MKAMLLAAGRGDRMRPLTDKTPKCLLIAGDKCLIEHQIFALKQAGIKDIVINVCYLAEQIMETLGDGKKYKVNLQYSVEPSALETGGGLLQALPLLGDEPFIVMSTDIWTDYPLQNLIHKIDDQLAHLILVNNPGYHPAGDYYLDDKNYLHLTGENKLTYASFCVLHPHLFVGWQSGVFRLPDVWNPYIELQQVTGEHYRGNWFNVGSPEELEAVNKFLK